MRRFLLSALTLLAIAGCVPAMAADLPHKAPLAPRAAIAPCYWCGLYIGGNLGYVGADFIADATEPDVSFSSKHSANSILGGVQLGYNYQFGLLVLGAETDFMFTGVHKTQADGTITELPWLGTTRLRGGFLVTPDLLVYGTGGVAYGHVKAGVSGGDVVATTPTVGWALGAGAEYAFSPTVKIGAEYLHVDLDGPSTTLGLLTIGTRVPVDIVRGRLSISFPGL